MLNQCWFDVGPPSATLAQHQTNIGPTSRVYCVISSPLVEAESSLCLLSKMTMSTSPFLSIRTPGSALAPSSLPDAAVAAILAWCSSHTGFTRLRYLPPGDSDTSGRTSSGRLVSFSSKKICHRAGFFARILAFCLTGSSSSPAILMQHHTSQQPLDKYHIWCNSILLNSADFNASHEATLVI